MGITSPYPRENIIAGNYILADMQAYLPKDLLDAEKVMPALADATLKQEKDGILTPATTSEDDLKAAFANRFSFSLAVANALRASDDAYHVGGTNLAVAPSLGNTNVSFDGGYLGGAEGNDAVVLTFEAPFLYKKSDGRGCGRFSVPLGS